MAIGIEDVKVYLITDGRRSRGRGVEEVVSEALAGGVRCVQYRPSQCDDRAFLETARRLREITNAAGSLLIINDRVDVATLSMADGVHLGANDIPIEDARRLLGDGCIVGYSAHGPEEALAAAAQGASYITYSPVFATTSFSAPRPPIGLEGFSRLTVQVPMPVFALGGISEANASELLDEGIENIAVVTAITEADDMRAAAARICALFGQPR